MHPWSASKVRVNKQLADMDQEAADAVAYAWGQRAAEKERRYARVATLWAVIGIVATVLVGLLARYLAL
jgi:type VI protein secretion system component VasF